MRLLLFLLMLALPAHGEEVVAALSQNRISINTNFDGSEILIFGAVKRETPIPGDAPLQVVITVSGPSKPVVVRRKDRYFGIWVNVEGADISQAPSFYAVATSDDWDAVLSDTADLRHKISVRRAIRSVGAASMVGDVAAFVDALIRIREDENLYQTNIGTVTFTESTLFDTAIRLPANLTEGDYTARFFLTRNGRVVDSYETVIDVRKVGLERFLFNLSREQPLVYGLMSLAIAIAAGWGASAFFRYLRG
ncbi:MAG: TIGR02186 family protein [Pseudomonadota bacterium]